jgi:hypothetical protein
LYGGAVIIRYFPSDFECTGFGYTAAPQYSAAYDEKAGSGGATCHLYADSANCAGAGSANDDLNWYTCKSKPCATQATLPDSLVGYWPLDGDGSDVSGHGPAQPRAFCHRPSPIPFLRGVHIAARNAGGE